MRITEQIKDGFLLFDGAMGTMLQRAGVAPDQLPELLNLTDPGLITSIHKAYVEAGCQVASANTFGANSLKLAGSGHTVEEVVKAGIACAKASGARWTALDLGPTGQLLEPMGTLSFEKAYDLYAEQIKAGAAAGADLILIETISDLYEAKAAILAARELTDLPVFCTLTFEEGQRTFIGADPLTAAVALNAWGVDALGVNCSLGPKELLPVVETLLAYAKVPVMVQANAGLPREENGRTVYDIGPEDYAAAVELMLEKGVRIVGGCCGTDPTYMARLHSLLKGRRPVEPHPRTVTAACSGTTTCLLDGRVSVIGERINPTGKKRLKEALREGRMDYIIGEAIDQTNAGADLLCVHLEADMPPAIREALKAMERNGVKKGIALRPITSPEAILPYLEDLDLVLVMTVEPGFGGQAFLEKQLPTIRRVRELIDQINPACDLEVDGGINPVTAQKVIEAGANVLVAGSAVYGAPDIDLAIESLRG